MADEWGGWDWGGGGEDYYESPPPTDYDTSWFDDWDSGGYEAPSTPSWQQQYEAPQTPSWQQSYDWAPTPDIQDTWGPPSWASPQDVQQWNQWQIPQEPLPGLGGGRWNTGPWNDALPAWKQMPQWDYSQGETGPDPMATPGPWRPWGIDSLPSQQDPRQFYMQPSAPVAPDLTDPATRFEAGLSDAESREQARNMVAGGAVMPIHKSMQGGPEWLNPLANPEFKGELPWPIDASGIGTVVPKGAFASSLWDVVRRVPGLAPFLETLQRNPTPIHLLDDPGRDAFGRTLLNIAGQSSEEAVSPGLLGLVRASPAPELAAEWRGNSPMFRPGQLGHSIDVSVSPQALLNPAETALFPNPAQLAENTLVHELRHAGGHLMPESSAYDLGRRQANFFPRGIFTPQEQEAILTSYPKWAWPAEIDARLFANQYFNPYLRP